MVFPFVTTPGRGAATATGPPNGSILRPLAEEAVAGNWWTNLKPLAGTAEDEEAVVAEPGSTGSGSGRFPRRPSQFNLIL